MTSPPRPATSPLPAGAPRTCPTCGVPRLEGATFCEACAHDFTGDDRAAGVAPTPPAPPATGASTGRSTGGGGPAGAVPEPAAVATPETAPAGEESPLDVGWTGRTVVGEAGAPQGPPGPHEGGTS